MNVNTKFNAAEAVAPVVIEEVFAEKPGGGIVANQTFVVKQGQALYADGTQFKPIKAYKLAAAVAAADTTFKIEKGSGITTSDIVGHGAKAVAVSAVNSSNAAYDLVTATLGVVIAKGTVLYQAASASADAAELVGTPVYVAGNDVPANEGDSAVRLINGANLRKETAPIAAEVVAAMKNINLV